MGILRTLSALAFCFVLAFGFSACGSSGGGSGQYHKIITSTLTALYNSSGANWNDYVKGDITNATDVACDPDTDTACVNGGELREVEVTGKSSCTGLTATDALGAFNWSCDNSTVPVRMVSTGLKTGKGLSDLIDFAARTWRPDSVTVRAGDTAYLQTPSSRWWSNPIELNNRGGILNSTGTIYVVTGTDNLWEDFIINAPSVGLVAGPGAIINGPVLSTGSFVVRTDGLSTAKDFLWIEGKVNATGDDIGVYLYTVKFSVLRNLSESGANSGTRKFGVHLSASSYNTLSNVTASNNDEGVYLYGSSNNTLSNVTASNNGTRGVHLSASFYNTLSGITASNNGMQGVYLYGSSNNTLSGITTSNNGFHGIHLQNSSNNTLSAGTASDNAYEGVYVQSSPDNTFSDITASNNADRGVWLNASNNNTFSGVTASNSGTEGVYLGSSSMNTFSGLTASNNGSDGIALSSSTNNYFTGLLKVGHNLQGNCHVSGGTNPGLVNTTCFASGHPAGGAGGYGANSSDATLTTGVYLTSSFVGKVYDDPVNVSDTGSAVDYPDDPSTFDWPHFENHYRAWGADGTFGASNSRGRFGCSNPVYVNQTDCENNSDIWNGYGAIWDWSLAATGDTGDNGGTALLGVLALPTGSNTLIHIWSSGDSSSCGTIAGATWGPVCSLPGYTGSGSCTGAGGTWGNGCYSVFLSNAVEISGTGGNDNLLCESGETCLYTPNIGSYQGHGNLVSAGTFVAGTITGVTLLKYDTNGR